MARSCVPVTDSQLFFKDALSPPVILAPALLGEGQVLHSWTWGAGGGQGGEGNTPQHSRSVFLVQGRLIPVQGRGDHHLLAAHGGGCQRGALQLQCVLLVPEVQKLPGKTKEIRQRDDLQVGRDPPDTPFLSPCLLTEVSPDTGDSPPLQPGTEKKAETDQQAPTR